jgi:protein involved in polysaccharide export with SLBB domain
MPRVNLAVCLALGFHVGSAAPSVAQDLGNSWMASRVTLERRALQLDSLASSPAYSEEARLRASAEGERIRRRLQDGDFRVGDRIYIEVDNSVLGTASTEAAVFLRDTLTVMDGNRVFVRGLGDVSLDGILRSELNGRIRGAVSEFLLNSRTTARPLIRLGVFGSISRPGYYSLPLEARLDAVLMLAGGPLADANPEGMRVMRGDTIVLTERDVLTYVANGTVIGEMGLQVGDQLVVSRRQLVLDANFTDRIVFNLLFVILNIVAFRTRSR